MAAIESRFSQLHVCEDDEVIQSDRDRLSELPDCLILSILSCLSMFDVVQTTILSKRWKDLWTTIPCLQFCFAYEYRFTYCVNSYGDFISGALAKWKGAKILKFSLSTFFGRPLISDIHSWLLFAMEKQVDEFCIDLNNYDCGYFLPQRFYSCSSITKLDLAIWDLQIEKTVQWNKLRSLTIRVGLCLSEYAMNQVLSGAPHLEELILFFWEISENLNIRSTSLKTLKIHVIACNFNETAVLRIWAPNLVTLDILRLNCCGLSFVVPSLTNAILSLRESDWDFMSRKNFNQVFRSISHVEKFTLSEWCIKLLLSMKDRNMNVPLSNAKFVKFYVHEAEEMLDVFFIFPKLMHTIVAQRYTKPNTYCCNKTCILEHKACFRSPLLLELNTVEITWPVGDASVVRVIEYLLENAHMLEKMVLRLTMEYGDNPETFVFAEEKVRSMPRSSPSVQLFVILSY